MQAETPPDHDSGAALAPAAAERGRLLLALARRAIEEAVSPAPAAHGEPSAASGERQDDEWLRAPGACFVTLTQAGRLRGCIGSVRARRSLGEDVRANALAAALADPRFPPLAAHEVAATRIEVSLLSAPVPLAVRDEAEALAALRPGTDGVILEMRGGERSTFLPQVWESLPSPREFLAQLKRKAGLPAGFWSAELRLFRYTVMHWQEPS
jgi:AmmeMemoRadiSam system protein A